MKQTALRLKLNAPNDTKSYDEFVSTAAKYGYDISKFPVDAYVIIYKEKSADVSGNGTPVTDRTLPTVKTTVDIDGAQVTIVVKPRAVGITAHGLLAADSRETREFVGVKRNVEYLVNVSRDHLEVHDDNWYYAGGGLPDVDIDKQPEGAHFSKDETIKMINMIGRVIAKLQNNPDNILVVHNLETTIRFLQGLL